MAKIDLSKYGITGATEIVYNPSYELLFVEEIKSTNEGYKVGKEREHVEFDVLLKTSTLLLMRTLRTLYGGHQMSTRTITTQCQKMYGLRLRTSLRQSFLIRNFS